MDKFEKFLSSVTMCHTCGGYTAGDMRKAWQESAKQECKRIVAILYEHGFLVCKNCDNTETMPYAVGDSCICGGDFVYLADRIEVLK